MPEPPKPPREAVDVERDVVDVPMFDDPVPHELPERLLLDELERRERQRA